MRRILMLVPLVGMLSMYGCKQEIPQPAQPRYPEVASRGVVPGSTAEQKGPVDDCVRLCAQMQDHCVRRCEGPVILGPDDITYPYLECLDECWDMGWMCDEECMDPMGPELGCIQHITCASPPAGCHYVGQVLDGPCDTVTCGTLACPQEQPPPVCEEGDDRYEECMVGGRPGYRLFRCHNGRWQPGACRPGPIP